MAKEKIDTIEKIAISQELKSAVFTDLDESRRVEKERRAADRRSVHRTAGQ